MTVEELRKKLEPYAGDTKVFLFSKEFEVHYDPQHVQTIEGCPDEEDNDVVGCVEIK